MSISHIIYYQYNYYKCYKKYYFEARGLKLVVVRFLFASLRQFIICNTQQRNYNEFRCSNINSDHRLHMRRGKISSKLRPAIGNEERDWQTARETFETSCTRIGTRARKPSKLFPVSSKIRN